MLEKVKKSLGITGSYQDNTVQEYINEVKQYLIICFAVLIHLNDEECIKVLDKFDEIIKNNGLLVINVMEWIKDEKEVFEDEPFNPKYKTYFNRYKKEFFIEYFKNKDYTVLEIIDNPLYNSSKVKGKVADANQFSIIVRKEKIERED